jgi:hypothetical protein
VPAARRGSTQSSRWAAGVGRRGRIDGDPSTCGYIPGDLYANCLFYFAWPGDLVVAPMAGSGQIRCVYDDRAVKPFRRAEQMLDAHELMFGVAGRQCAKVILRWATILFAVPLDALNIRIVLAPVELDPYNRHAGYHYKPGEGAFIPGNRHIVDLKTGMLVLKQHEAESLLAGLEDFIVHELTHARQAQLEREHGWKRTRGDHRDLGWYAAVAEACPQAAGQAH